MVFRMIERLLSLAEIACDKVCDLKKYEPGAGARPKVIAHRGDWDRLSRLENTLAAFEAAKLRGADGIEFDVHFTKDDVPVVHHDSHLRRIFGREEVIAQMTYEELHAVVPQVPTLKDVLQLRELHFMIEMKTSLNFKQQEILHGHLAHLRVCKDFHLLVLNPALVRESPALPATAWILVGELKLAPLVELSLSRKFGGVAGHYLGMTDVLVGKLHQAGQLAGVGFTPTKNMLHREWGRGIDFVYTNSIYRLS